MKKYLFYLLIVVMCLTIGFGVYAHEGRTDKYGGHFVQRDGLAVAYHYHSGNNAGYELIFNKSIIWDDREGLCRPFSIEDDSLGCWKFYKGCDFGNTYDGKCGNDEECQPSEECTPQEECNPEETAEPTTTINNETTPVETPAIKNADPKKTLPKTGENDNIIISIIGFVFAAIGSFMVFKKKSANATK